jgi:hypothetical protein
MLLDEVKKRVDLVFVITASSNGRLGESRAADLLWSEVTARVCAGAQLG